MEPTVPEDWAWTPIEVECASCGQSNPLHEQPPELLAEGVAWECNHCGARNVLGDGSSDVEFDTVIECGACHATFTSGVDVDADGLWTCPSCSTPNRDVSHDENASSVEQGAAS